MPSDEQKETPKPPDGYSNWIEGVFADLEIRGHWFFGDVEKGRYHTRREAVEHARTELAALREQLSKADKYAAESHKILRAAGWGQGHIETAHEMIADFERSAKTVQELREQVRQTRNAAMEEATVMVRAITEDWRTAMNETKVAAGEYILRKLQSLKGS